MYQNNKRTTTTTTTSSSSSSTSTRAHAREAEINVSVESIKELYQAAIGSPMTDICQRYLRRDLEAGIPYIYYHYALEQTAFAPRPSWRYTMAIVARLRREEVDPAALMLEMSLSI